MNKLTKHYKRVVWDWLVSLPTDEIAEKTGVGIQVSLSSQPYEGNEFEKYIEGYKGWPDEERKQFQRAFFAYRKYVFDPQNKGALSRLILRGFMALGDKKETKKT